MDSNTSGCDIKYQNDANYIVIDHGDGTEAVYWHLKQQSSKLNKGDYVLQGEDIAQVGLTGYTCGDHLHFQVQNNCSGNSDPYCQSIQISFDDVTNGIPTEGQSYTSGNYLPYFHGSGYVIEPAIQSSSTEGYGWSKAQLFSENNKKGVIGFNWVYNSNLCDHIDLSAYDSNNNEVNLNLYILAGELHTRDNDTDIFYKATTPVSIGHPRNYENFIGLMTAEVPNKNYTIYAECSSSISDNKYKMTRNANYPGFKFSTGYTFADLGTVFFNAVHLFHFSTIVTPFTDRNSQVFINFHKNLFCKDILIFDLNLTTKAKIAWKSNSSSTFSNETEYTLPKLLGLYSEAASDYIISIKTDTTEHNIYGLCVNLDVLL